MRSMIRPSTPVASMAAASASMTLPESLVRTTRPHERADHEHLAVREVQHAEHAEDQRVADGDQRVHGAEHHAVDELLGEHG